MNTGRRIGPRVAIALGLSASAIWAAIAAGSARAYVIVGSPISTNTTGFFSGPNTEVNTVLAEPGAYATSPVNGTIFEWHIVVENPGPMAFRVIRPAGGGTYTGVATGPEFTPSSACSCALSGFSFLPIRVGDLVGLDLITSAAQVGSGPIAGSTVEQWGGLSGTLLADGSTAPPDNVFTNHEVAFDAFVRPSNDFSVDGIRRHKKKGTATLNLTLPNPGELSGSGDGAKVASAAGAVISKAVGATPAQLLIKANGKKKKKLNETGKVKLNVKVTYTPTGGDPSSQSVKVKLKKKL